MVWVNLKMVLMNPGKEWRCREQTCGHSKGRSGTNEENSIDIYTQSCVKYIAAEKLLYYTGSRGWHSVMT